MGGLTGSQTQLQIFVGLRGKNGLGHCCPFGCVVKLKQIYFFSVHSQSIAPSYTEYHTLYSVPILTKAICVRYVQVHFD